MKMKTGKEVNEKVWNKIKKKDRQHKHENKL